MFERTMFGMIWFGKKKVKTPPENGLCLIALLFLHHHRNQENHTDPEGVSKTWLLWAIIMDILKSTPKSAYCKMCFPWVDISVESETWLNLIHNHHPEWKRRQQWIARFWPWLLLDISSQNALLEIKAINISVGRKQGTTFPLNIVISHLGNLKQEI